MGNENKLEIRFLTPDDIDVKVKQVTAKGAVLLLYKNSRVDMRILDDTFGSMNWECDYKEIKGNLYCGIGIRESEDKPYVWKWDCGIESREDDGNEKKGEASDSFKRAGFKWGIGRELYTSPFIFAKVETAINGNSYKLADPFAKFYVQDIDYVARKISKLVIVDGYGYIVYTYGTKKQSITPPTPQPVESSPVQPQTSSEPPKNEQKQGTPLEAAEVVVLTFGKYKDKQLKDVPVDYLEWLAENSTTPAIKSASDLIVKAKKGGVPEKQVNMNDDDGLPF